MGKSYRGAPGPDGRQVGSGARSFAGLRGKKGSSSIVYISTEAKFEGMAREGKDNKEREKKKKKENTNFSGVRMSRWRRA